MHREDLLVDDCGNWQAVEAIRKSLPELDVVASLAFIIEAIDAVDGGAFVIATQDEEVLWILDLVRKEQADGFEGLLAAVHVIAKEEVIRFWWEAAVLKESQKIVVLPVNVAADLVYTCQLTSKPSSRLRFG